MLGAHVADFVEEQRAAVGLFEAADALLVRARVRALLVPEELGLEQVLLQRRAVDLDERARRSVRVVVDRAGDQFLARARFAADQHRRVAARHLLHDAEHLLQRAARADDAVEIIEVLLLVAQVLHLVLEMAELDRLFDLELHFLDFEGLLHEVEGADLHRLDGRVNRPEGRHEDDRRARLNGPRRAEHVHAVGAAHAKVGQHDVELAVLQPLDGGRPVAGLLHVVAGVGQRADEALAERIVIVDHQNASHLHYLPTLPTDGTTGSVTRKVAPRPGAETASIRPSCASTTLRTIARPRPVPCGFVVKNGLKIRSRSSGAIPGPLSRISTTTWGASASPVPSGCSSPGSEIHADVDVALAAERFERVREKVREQLSQLMRVGQQAPARPPRSPCGSTPHRDGACLRPA